MEPRALVWLPTWKIHPAVWLAMVQADLGGLFSRTVELGWREAPPERGLAGPAVKWSAWQPTPAAAQACPAVDQDPAQALWEEDWRQFAWPLPNPQSQMSSLPPPAGRSTMSPAMEPGAGGWGLGLGPKAGTPPPPSWSRFPHSSESPVFFWEGGVSPSCLGTGC